MKEKNLLSRHFTNKLPAIYVRAIWANISRWSNLFAHVFILQPLAKDNKHMNISSERKKLNALFNIRYYEQTGSSILSINERMRWECSLCLQAEYASSISKLYYMFLFRCTNCWGLGSLHFNAHMSVFLLEQIKSLERK